MKKFKCDQKTVTFENNEAAIATLSKLNWTSQKNTKVKDFIIAVDNKALTSALDGNNFKK